MKPLLTISSKLPSYESLLSCSVNLAWLENCSSRSRLSIRSGGKGLATTPRNLLKRTEQRGRAAAIKRAVIQGGSSFWSDENRSIGVLGAVSCEPPWESCDRVSDG